MSSSEGEGEGQQQQQQPQLLGSGKARAPNRHRFKRLAERIDDVSHAFAMCFSTAVWAVQEDFHSHNQRYDQHVQQL
jgi:hypothetical protein